MNYFVNGFSFSIDLLSVFFMGVILIVSLPSLLYSLGYLKGKSHGGSPAAQQTLFIGFICSMIFAVTFGNAFLFLIAWELMSLLSYFLVISDKEHKKSVRAGTIYIIMTHIGTAFITAALLILYNYSGSFDFAAMKAAAGAMPDTVRTIVFLCFFTGFGTKAGIVPLHIWLPYAHPEAPSHVSSVMSGVMVKVAVYGMLRFIIGILGVTHAWWGYFALFFAVLSCIIGVIYALIETDIKRMLAYSTVENIGIILLGISLSMIFAVYGMHSLSVLAMLAGLYHVINHAVFKSLLFMGAGAVLKAAGTKNMEKLGGLIRNMPWTAGAFLAGCIAISGLPPFNGFVSEWLTLQAFFSGALHASGAQTKLAMGIGAAALALTGGLAAAAFAKAFGITFLAMPRSKKASEAIEVHWTMRFSMGLMALSALILGIGAPWIAKIIAPIAGYSAGINDAAYTLTFNKYMMAMPGALPAAVSPALIFVVLSVIILLIVISIYFSLGKSSSRKGITWGCGYYNLDSRNEYTSTAFSKPFRIAFSFLLLPYRKKDKIMESKYHMKSYTYEVHTIPVFRYYFYWPAIDAVLRTARFMRRLQPGSIHLYISYIFVTILFLIIFMYKF